MSAMTGGRRWVVLAAALITVACASPAGALPSAAPSMCRPGSGPDLHGRRVTITEVPWGRSLACANLAGADLAGLDLTQRALHGAILRGADLTGADLTQADLSLADLTGAKLGHARLVQASLDGALLADDDLSGANLSQAGAQWADFRGADLSDADFTQAHLDNARLDDADVGGASFGQAHLDGTSFQHVRGLMPWDVYLLIAAGALFLVVAIRALRRYARMRAVAVLPAAIGGRLLTVLGAHLFVGYLLGRATSSDGPPIDRTCRGVQCSFGVAAGSWAPFAGFAVFFLGCVVSVAAERAASTQRGTRVVDLRQSVGPRPARVPIAATVPTPGPPMSPPPERTLTPGQLLLPRDVLDLALAGRKRAAMRRYREQTGASRFEAKSVLADL